MRFVELVLKKGDVPVAPVSPVSRIEVVLVENSEMAALSVIFYMYVLVTQSKMSSKCGNILSNPSMRKRKEINSAVLGIN